MLLLAKIQSNYVLRRIVNPPIIIFVSLIETQMVLVPQHFTIRSHHFDCMAGGVSGWHWQEFLPPYLRAGAVL